MLGIDGLGAAARDDVTVRTGWTKPPPLASCASGPGA